MSEHSESVDDTQTESHESHTVPGDEQPQSPQQQPVARQSDPDLDAIGRDLDDVQAALERLNDGAYWTDEVTGEPIPDDVLAEHPTARTARRDGGTA